MSLFLLSAEVADVAPETVNWLAGSGSIYTDILVITLVVFMIVLLFFAVVIQRALRSILKITMPETMALEAEKVEEAKLQRKAYWQRTWKYVSGLRPIEEEEDIAIDHEFDGIRELDNPIPVWFNALFYSTVLFGVVYLFTYHVFGWGMNQDQEYVHEVAQAEKVKSEYLAKAANLIDESTIVVDPSLAPAGKALFAANCAACHGNNGEGTIGPNLTDRSWLHGGEIKDVFKTVKYGVPEKGMVPWEQTLTPGQIAEVSNYILTLRDTNPPNGKAPEGIEVKVYDSEGNASGSADSTTVN